jgi:hypothetical protein
MKAITRHTHGRSVAAALMSGVVVLLMVGVFNPAAAAAVDANSDQDIVVQLGVHHFGDLREPDAVVATVGADDVGFYQPPNGEGYPYGPQSFEVTPDGSIWLLDSINYRLLVWEPGQLTEPARVPLPLGVADFALGLDGTIYATYPDPDSELKTLGLCAVTATGDLLWKAPTNIEISNAELLTGPDGSIYVFGADESQAWTQLVTPDGQALTLDEQAEATTSYQPLAGGQRLTEEYVSPTEQRFTLTDQDGKVVHAWHVESDTELGSNYTRPTLVDGDLVAALDVFEQTQNNFLYEYLVLRLSPTGVIQQQFSLDHRAVWGDDTFAGVRVGPNGQLYQLSTDLTTGASITMLSLDPAPVPAPSPSSAPANVEPAPAPAVAETPAQHAALKDAPEVSLAASPAAAPAVSPAPTKHAGGRNLVGLFLLAGGLIALGVWYWFGRRRRAAADRPAWNAEQDGMPLAEDDAALEEVTFLSPSSRWRRSIGTSSEGLTSELVLWRGSRGSCSIPTEHV